MGGGSLKDQEIVILEWTSAKELKSRCKQKRLEPRSIEDCWAACPRDLQLTVRGKSQVGADVLLWERTQSGRQDGATGWFADATDGSLSPDDNFDLVIGYSAAGKSPSPEQFDDWPAQQREGRLHPVLVPKGDETALVFTDVYNNSALPTRADYAAAAAAAAAANDSSLNKPTGALKEMRLSLRVTHKTLAAVCLGANRGDNRRDVPSDCKKAGFWLLLREKSDMGESAVAQADAILAKGAVRGGMPLAMDVAPAPGVMERDPLVLVQRVRKGVTIDGENEAKPYADSLEFKKTNHTGPYCVHCLCCSCLCGCECFKRCDYCHCCTVPLCCTYNFFLPLSERFLCFGPCLPIPLPIVNCERDVNRFVCCYCCPGKEQNRKSDGSDDGICVRSQLMVIDEERGTLAFYCPTDQHNTRLNAKPCCIFKRIF